MSGTGEIVPSGARMAFWSMAENCGLVLLSLGALLLVARLVGPGELGAFAIALGIVQLLTTVVDTFVHDAIIQKPDLTDEHLDTAFWTCTALGLAATAACWMGSDFLGHLFDNARVGPLTAVASLGLAVGGTVAVPVAVLRRRFMFKSLALRSLLGRGGAAVVALALAAAGFGVWALVAQHLTQVFVGAALLWPASPWRPRLKLSPSKLGELLSFGVYSVGTRVVWAGGARLFVLMVGSFIGTTAVGYLNVAQRMAEALFDLMAGAVQNLALPLFARLQANHDALIKIYGKANRYTSFVALPLFAGLGVSADTLLPLLLGSEWLPAVPLVQILSFGAVIQFLFLFTPTTVSAIGRPDLVFAVSIVTVLAVLGAFLLLHPVDVVTATWIWVARSAVAGPLGVLVLWRLLKLSPLDLLRLHWAPLTASVGMVASLLLLDRFLSGALPPLGRLAVLVPSGVALYSAMAVILGGQSFVDLITSPRRLFSPKGK